jgi:hypothetical protein
MNGCNGFIAYSSLLENADIRVPTKNLRLNYYLYFVVM